jgi:hypothetical protein
MECRDCKGIVVLQKVHSAVLVDGDRDMVRDFCCDACGFIFERRPAVVAKCRA